MQARVAKVAGAAVIAGVGGGAYLYNTDDGMRRSMLFWSVAAPIYGHYRFVQWRVQGLPEEEADAQYNRLHEKYAPVVEDLVLDLKGFYLKQAQTVSTRDEFVPPAYMEFCKRCQDKVPTVFEPGQPQAIVEEALGVPLASVFSSWDEKPLGVASIGEAHRATLKDGRKVVVKVMMPGIEDKFRSDLKTIITFCDMAQPQHSGPLREIERQFLTEFDYVLEAQNMQEVHDNIMPTFGDVVVVPKPIPELCRKSVLVMEELDGVRLVDGVRGQYRKYAEKQGTTLEAMEEEQKRKLRLGLIERRDVAAEEARTQWLQRLVAVKNTVSNTPRALYNWTLGWFAAPFEYEWEEAPINLARVIHILDVVHSHEIFHDGVFNGDPHPGNVLLCTDGRIGLIDYGQVKRLPLSVRVKYAKLIIALASEDKEAILREFKACGVVTTHMNPDVLWRLATFWHDRDTADVIGDRNIQEFMDWAEAEDPAVNLPEDYVMAARVSIMMRGISNAFGLRLRTAPTWAKAAQQLLDDVEDGRPTGYRVDE